VAVCALIVGSVGSIYCISANFLLSVDAVESNLQLSVKSRRICRPSADIGCYKLLSLCTLPIPFRHRYPYIPIIPI